ncbi:MFS transporter [Viridibacillus sp. FSL R5-0477]|uniref:Quinolone resistance protein n=1 Tax=Viridibacillus arenosi FSL R5-213 TaxID=1227360 RepID=W4EQJ7_9BACL|nr:MULTISPECIES: MFS transporter [Viridibacillus]ETT82853.1 quinolone resistance protein [Viridibacillus arenosi FSL R5-213]OMC82197.1 MFS transporter [Viridibacillus sp. FSL H8-0123]OMC86354.1 MFS transporter [Viridibacillus sp. FSL H7-0596]OMC90742.1 MFS transporter [Viridibacillus arenosi]
MKKSILLLMSVQFFVYLGFGLIIPILPEVVVQQGFNKMHVGGLLTVYSLASFFTAPLWGMLSDKMGRKKLILVGLLGFCTSFLLISLFIDSLTMLYVSRVVGGLFSGALYTAVTGFIGDMSTEENRNKYMGFMGMSIGLGFIFGPAIGGLLGHYSLSLPFTASAILIFLLFIYASIVLVEPERLGEANKRAIVPKGASTLFKYRVRYLFLFSFVVTFLLAGVESTLQLFQMDKINITSAQLGSLFLFSGFVDFLVQGGLVRRIKDGSEAKWLMIAQIITACGLLLFPFTTSLAFAGFALCVFTAGNALARTLTVSLTSKESGGKYGTAAGITYSMDNMGRIIGPLFFTWVFTMQANSTYFISASLAVVSILVILLFKSAKKTLRISE